MLKKIIGKYFVKGFNDEIYPCRVADIEEVNATGETKAHITFEILARDLYNVRFIKFMPLSWVGEAEFLSLKELDMQMFGNTERSDCIKRAALEGKRNGR